MKHLTLRSLLIIGFGLLIGLLAIIGGLSIYSASNSSDTISDMVARRLPDLVNYGMLETDAYALHSLALAAFRNETASSASAKSLKEIIDARKTAWRHLDETIQKIETTPWARTKDLHDKMIDSLDEYRRLSAPLDDILPRLASAATSGNSAQFINVRKEYKGALEKTLASSEQLHTAVSDYLQKQADLGESDAQASIEQSRTYIVLITTLLIGGILYGIFIGFAILRTVLRQIGGNPTNDADKMAQQADGAVHEGTDTTLPVLTDICRMANDVGSVAKSVEELGEQSREIASVVNITVATDEIRKLAEHTSASTKDITHIVGLIKEVANQTNLLALNAAFEAAHAGEQDSGLVDNETAHTVQATRQQSEGAKTSVDLSESSSMTAHPLRPAPI